MRLYDAHNHLQDERFTGRQPELVATSRAAGIVRMVVNGSCEEDWPRVTALAVDHPDLVLPSFGIHPWHTHEVSSAWQSLLLRQLEIQPSAIGEIGLDRWKPDLPYAGQEEVFLWQLRLAAERNLPVSIHCLRTWGRLHDLLRSHPRPDCGFLLHSYGGPQEMVKPLANLGAYFSLPGAFAHERRTRQRELFLQVPPDRLLLETDAPDQRLPEDRNQHPLADPASGDPINHPANLVAVYEFAAGLLREPLDRLAARIETNFRRLFGD